MLMVMVQVLNHLQMTDLLTELLIIYCKYKGEVEDRKARGQEVKYISMSMEVEINNKQIRLKMSYNESNSTMNACTVLLLLQH